MSLVTDGEGEPKMLSGLKCTRAQRNVQAEKSQYSGVSSEHLGIVFNAYFHVVKQGLLAAAESLQSCPTLCDPTGGSPPGSPVPGILQARTLEWAARPSSKGSSRTSCIGRRVL